MSLPHSFFFPPCTEAIGYGTFHDVIHFRARESRKPAQYLLSDPLQEKSMNYPISGMNDIRNVYTLVQYYL